MKTKAMRKLRRNGSRCRMKFGCHKVGRRQDKNAGLTAGLLVLKGGGGKSKRGANSGNLPKMQVPLRSYIPVSTSRKVTEVPSSRSLTRSPLSLPSLRYSRYHVDHSSVGFYVGGRRKRFAKVL